MSMQEVSYRTRLSVRLSVRLSDRMEFTDKEIQMRNKK